MASRVRRMAAIALGLLLADALPVGGSTRPEAVRQPVDGPDAAVVPGTVWTATGGSILAEGSGGPLRAPARPDIAATPLGFVLGDGPYAWGHRVRVDDPTLLSASRSGHEQDLCVLAPAGFRTFNSGAAPTGAFTVTVYRDDVVVHAERMALPAHGGAAFQPFDLPVHRGLNTIKVVVDSSDEVSESDEDNSFVISLDVVFDCDGSSTEAAR